MIKRIGLILFVITMALIQLTFTACENAQSRAKKIVSLRAERKQLLDTLYQAYGGSDLSQSVKSSLRSKEGAESSTENQIVQGLANLTVGADRTMFEQSVRTVGSGENLLILTDRAKQFFARSDVVKKANKICEIDIELEQLEKKGN